MNIPALTIRVQDFNIVAGKLELLKKLRKLTICPYSGMNYELNNFEKICKIRQVKCKIFTAYSDKKLVGWAMLSREPTGYFGDKFNPEDGSLFEVFVDLNYRHQGIGSALIKSAKRRAGGKGFCVAPFDEISFNYFNKFSTYQVKKLF